MSGNEGLMKGMFVAQRQRVVNAPPVEVYRVVTGLGGKRGWLALNWVWRLRGAIDRLIGGVGLRRGRRDPDDLRVGDTVDCWCVETLEPNRLLRLRAEMNSPGQGWLQFEIEPLGDSKCRLVQTAFFAPKGLLGHVYWLVLAPVHALIFSNLIRKTVKHAEHNHRVSSDVLGENH